MFQQLAEECMLQYNQKLSILKKGMFFLTPEHEDTPYTAQKPFQRQSKVQNCRLPFRILLSLSLLLAEALWLAKRETHSS